MPQMQTAISRKNNTADFEAYRHVVVHHTSPPDAAVARLGSVSLATLLSSRHFCTSSSSRMPQLTKSRRYKARQRGTAGRSSQHFNQALPRTQRAIVFASCMALPLTPEDAGKIGSHRRYTGEALPMDYLTSRPQGAILGSRGRLTSSPPDVMAYRGRLSALGSPTLNLERSDQLRLSNLQPVPRASHVQQPWASGF
jgi:hypothetical protein